MTRGVLAALLAVTALLGACGGGQDPGVPASPSNEGPTTTSHLLSACPTATGATVPPEGCLDGDGKVVQP